MTSLPLRRLAPALFLVVPACSGGALITATDASGDGEVVPVSNQNAPDGGTGKGAGDGSVDAPFISRPLDAGTPTNAGAASHNFAMNNLFLGDTANGDLTFVLNPDGWSDIGRDIDGVNTNNGSAAVSCTPPTGGGAVVDGLNGIDNSFGYNITPIIAGTLGYTSQKLSVTGIQHGTFTYMFDIAGITPSVATESATGLATSVYVGAPYESNGNAGPPPFNIATEWPVASSSLSSPNGPSLSLASNMVFLSSSIAEGNFTSGPPADGLKLELVLAPATGTVGALTLPLIIDQAVITFQLDASGAATSGVISGVISLTNLETAIAQWLGAVGNGEYCATADAIVSQLPHFADIMSDGSRGAGEMCDAISIGLGFTAREIAQPTAVTQMPDAGSSVCIPQ